MDIVKGVEFSNVTVRTKELATEKMGLSALQEIRGTT
jgi:hypothetical protein